MKRVFELKHMVHTGLALAAIFTGRSALADVVCQGQGGTPLVKAFVLASGDDPFGWSKDAAIILNKGTGNVLLIGKVVTTPTRVGTRVRYTVNDPTGAESHLSYSLSVPDETFLNCTRAGCDDPAESAFAAALVHAGESYAVQCENAGL